MTQRSDEVAYRQANLATYQARHRGSRFAGTARNNAYPAKHLTVAPNQQGSKWGNQPPTT